MSGDDVERLADLLRALPPAPAGWVRAAQELPLARQGLADIVARAEADEQFRRALVSDLESALEAAGYTPEPALVERLRERLAGSWHRPAPDRR